MNIHNAKRRHMQHLIRQNAAIGCHTENISVRGLERLNNLRRHTIGLNNRQTQLKRLGLNRRRLKLLTTPTNSIRTRNNKRNLIPSRNKRSQRRHRKIRRTHKHNTHKSKSPLKNEPRRLQKKRSRPQARPSAKTVQQEQIYPKPKKEPHQKQLSQQRHYQRRRPSLAQRHPGEPTSNSVVPGMEATHIVPRAVSQQSENV